MGIKQFEDIQAWKIARVLTQSVYRVTSQANFSRDFGLKEQIQRASVSTMANIAEGFDSQSGQEFSKFLRYALRSATEIQSHLYVALDQDYISEDQFQDLYNQTVESKKLIMGFMRYLRNQHS